MPKDPPLFDPGQIVATPAALALLTNHGVSPTDLITRHLSGDFGDVGMLGPGSLDEDRKRLTRPHAMLRRLQAS